MHWLAKQLGLYTAWARTVRWLTGRLCPLCICRGTRLWASGGRRLPKTLSLPAAKDFLHPSGLLCLFVGRVSAHDGFFVICEACRVHILLQYSKRPRLLWISLKRPRHRLLVRALRDLLQNTLDLLLRSFGGPEGLTRFARQLGDPVTRLDRWEPELNEATPGDPRDTSSPRAMVELLRQAVLGPALSAGSRQQLAQWLQATQTNLKRLASDLPASWRVGSKTGTGAHGSTNDVGLYWLPDRAPIVVAVFLTETKASLEAREAVIAQVARRVHGLRSS